MLLAIIHANGTYQAHLGEHDPIVTEDKLWKPDTYHSRLASTILAHLDLEMPVIYVPHWNNAWDTKIFNDTDMRVDALTTDPFLETLEDKVGRISVFPQAAGKPPNNNESIYCELARERALLSLSQESGKVVFVGAYTTACVAEQAVWTANRLPNVEVSIDPSLSVDILGEAFIPNKTPDDRVSFVKLDY